MVVDLETDEVVDHLFHALADATRRDILRRSIGGELSVSRLAEAYPMSFAAVQKHVAVLERAGLVTKERYGREQLVRTDPDAVHRTRQALDQLEMAWRGRVDRMSDLLAQDTDPEPEQPDERTRLMSVTSVDKDFDNLTLTLVADFDAPLESVWQLWADPRLLERWWGPADPPRDLRGARPEPRRRGHLLHDRSGGRQVPGLVAGHVDQPAEVPRVHRRVRR